MVIRGNVVFGNQNRVPYYNEKYDDPAYLAEKQMHVARPGYGSVNQTFIIDGSGVYITRNSQSYLHGWYLLTRNTCFGNGLNGVVVHKTHRAIVTHNVIYDNGQTPKDPPESRQPYAGLVLNSALNVTLGNNSVTTSDADDFAYVVNDGSSFADGVHPRLPGPAWRTAAERR